MGENINTEQLLDFEFYEEPDLEKSQKILKEFQPDIEDIVGNKNRCAIIHMLLKKRDTLHTTRVSKIANKLEIHRSTVIYHLEFLKDYELVVPRKENSKGRIKWGLKTKYPVWVKKVYNKILKEHSIEDLENTVTNKILSKR